MGEVDADNSGEISYDEFKAAMFDILTKRASFTNNKWSNFSSSESKHPSKSNKYLVKQK